MTNWEHVAKQAYTVYTEQFSLTPNCPSWESLDEEMRLGWVAVCKRATKAKLQGIKATPMRYEDDNN
jgi:hypothetical protein